MYKFFHCIYNWFSDESIKKTLSVSAFFASLVFAALGVWIIPMGILDKSILIWCAQLLLISAAYLGIKIDFDLNNKKFTSNVDVKPENVKTKKEKDEEEC